jgi:peptide/nickel transport system permease protein
VNLSGKRTAGAHRAQFNQFPHNVLFPGIFLALTVLAVNILGDGLRDTLDPKFNKRGG